MPTNKKYKILLIQLPAPTLNFMKHWGNVPLAAGYFKAMAYKERLLNEVDIEILSEKDTNLSSDSRLIGLIISRSPDMLGFSLYNWNSIRSLFIAREVKKKLPNIKIIVGGPEVTLETKYILNNPVVSIGCVGEGEIAFVEIIKDIVKGKENHTNINGIFYRKSGAIIVTPPSEPIQDLNQIPSPFALGFINPKDYQTVCYESVRGCLFKCSYCATALKSMRYFSVDRICEDLKIILKSGKIWVRFIDSDFTLHPDHYEICEKMKEINSEKKLIFAISIHGGRIDKMSVDSLKECNCSDLGIGLQSIKPETLENIQRPPVDKAKFITGLSLLKEKGFKYHVDIMIGLPNDTLHDLRKTSKFLKENKVREVVPFVLTVLPGTRLRRETKRYGIRYQRNPPYLLIETDYISKGEIEDAINLFKTKPRPAFGGNFISHNNLQYLGLQKKGELINFLKIKPLDNNICKLIVELDHTCQSKNQIGIMAKKLNRMLYQPFTIWFKSQNIEQNLPLIKSFILPIASSNPFLMWRVILETDNIPTLQTIEGVKGIIRTKEKILADVCHSVVALAICTILPWKSNNRNSKLLSILRDIAPFFWSLNISSDDDWRGEINNLSREKYGSGILIDFDQKSNMGFIIKVLKFIYKKTKTKSKDIFFRNFSIDYLQKLIAQKEESKDISIILPQREDIESIVSFDKNMNISSALASSNETVMDLVECQMSCQKVLKR